MRGLEVTRGETAIEIFASPEILVREETRNMLERIEQLEKIVGELQNTVKMLISQHQ